MSRRKNSRLQDNFKIVMESANIDIRAFLFFHLSDIEKQNLNEQFKIVQRIEDKEKRLFKKVYPFLEALWKSVKILREHMGEKADLEDTACNRASARVCFTYEMDHFRHRKT